MQKDISSFQAFCGVYEFYDVIRKTPRFQRVTVAAAATAAADGLHKQRITKLFR
jgi:hypothetical protein